MPDPLLLTWPEFVELLGKYISNTGEPLRWLPIVVLVIAWWIATKAIRSLQKDKYHQRLLATNQELCSLLIGANLKIVFLSFLLGTVSWVWVSNFLGLVLT